MPIEPITAGDKADGQEDQGDKALNQGGCYRDSLADAMIDALSWGRAQAYLGFILSCVGSGNRDA
ncbi:hypothetical protein GCM10007874_43770 [Labrys miyagiensis]|uniref:Uncharacterized protein n=1 Tax=Labrys miyagiensis TaxID=346912 RepID=A0ABQ6CNH4_9HYPH|nr:hypothetical protein GCM10007874_43770 [Labrys miyagiensis]